MTDMFELKTELFEVLREKGAALAGVADLKEIIQDEKNIGISVAVPVPQHIIEDLKTAPTKEYFDTYHKLNAKLDEIVEAGAEFLIKKGYKAQANTLKIVKKDENWCTPLPHKTVATNARLGWIGKSCLLVTKEYGSAVRISSLITNAPLPADEAVKESRCENCRNCVDKCPAKAFLGINWSRGMSREKIFIKEVCKKTQLERMKKATGIDVDLCGLRFAVCPYTQRYLNLKG